MPKIAAALFLLLCDECCVCYELDLQLGLAANAIGWNAQSLSLDRSHYLTVRIFCQSSKFL